MNYRGIINAYNRKYSSINLLFFIIYFTFYILKYKTAYTIVIVTWIVALIVYLASEVFKAFTRKKYFKLVADKIASSVSTLTQKHFEDYYEMTKFVDPLREFARDTAESFDLVDNSMFANIWFEPCPADEHKYAVDIELFTDTERYFIAIDENNAVTFTKQ